MTRHRERAIGPRSERYRETYTRQVAGASPHFLGGSRLP
jgi:hypothetical protein